MSEQQNLSMAKLRRSRKENNLCIWCGKPNDSSNVHCTDCLKKMVAQHALLSQKRRSNGVCPECPDIAVTAGSYSLCMKCWFRKMSKLATGTKSNWQALQRVYERQYGKCAYTGIELIPGLTASIDHILPTSRGGTHDEHNLQWVTKQINCMKTDMTHDEFLAMCQLILEKAQPSGTVTKTG